MIVKRNLRDPQVFPTSRRGCDPACQGLRAESQMRERRGSASDIRSPNNYEALVLGQPAKDVRAKR